MTNLVPTSDGVLESGVDVGVAIVGHVDALVEGLGELNRALELGVSDPEGEDVVRAEGRVELLGVGAAAINALIEIVNVAHDLLLFFLS